MLQFPLDYDNQWWVPYLWTYKVNPLQPKNLISLVFMSQSSSGIDYEEFRPFEVGLTPLVANGSNLGVQLDF